MNIQFTIFKNKNTPNKISTYEDFLMFTFSFSNNLLTYIDSLSVLTLKDIINFILNNDINDNTLYPPHWYDNHEIKVIKTMNNILWSIYTEFITENNLIPIRSI